MDKKKKKRYRGVGVGELSAIPAHGFRGYQAKVAKLVSHAFEPLALSRLSPGRAQSNPEYALRRAESLPSRGGMRDGLDRPGRLARLGRPPVQPGIAL